MYLGGESGTPEKQQPPRLTYHYVNGKLTDAIEAQYKKRDGRWIAFSGRIVVFDSEGKNHSEVKFDLNEQEQQAVMIRTSPLTLHGRTAMTALASLFGPRELYAQGQGITPDVLPEEACGVICATAAAEAARALALSSQATKLTFECITGDLPSCLEVQAAITEAAQAVSSAATWAASCYNCLNPPKPPAPPALPSGGGGSGYCVYRITYYADTGEIISTELLYCL